MLFTDFRVKSQEFYGLFTVFAGTIYMLLTWSHPFALKDLHCFLHYLHVSLEIFTCFLHGTSEKCEKRKIM